MQKNIEFEKAKWIWTNENPQADEYGEFYSTFEYTTGKACLSISADSNYAAYVNGQLAAFGQYADYPHDKVYDTVDITKYCKKGKNHLAIIVWYYGLEFFSTYCKGNAAVMYEIFVDEKSVCYSSEETLSRKSVAYRNHLCKVITNQLGISYNYDATKEDGWMNGELLSFEKSVRVNQSLPLRSRPCEKLALAPMLVGKKVKEVYKNDVIYDLGVNTAGFLYIEAESAEEQHLLIGYGEHIADGVVRQRIGARDFSVEITLKKGKTVYMNPFRRLGCKYLEIHAEKPVEIKCIGVVPPMYPLKKSPAPNLTKAEQEIYDSCIRTLSLCMHEHYEDCSWREQALYCMDSRNQMLCGYYAFNEFTFPRACLQLISKDRHPSGLLSICYPISHPLIIPSFSLHYFIECAEYLRYSGDKAFLEEIYPKLESVLKVYLDRLAESDGVVPPFPGENDWNFYEWTNHLDGYSDVGNAPDVLLNALLSIALQRMAEISVALGKEDRFTAIAGELNQEIFKNFYSKEKGLFIDRMGSDDVSMLGNALAILCGACDKETAAGVCESIVHDKSLTQISLSMRCFAYDACLKVNKEKYTSYVLDDIERIYRPMIEYGTGTVWETELGEKDFENAGSLCHGWSAMPVYYYHILKK